MFVGNKPIKSMNYWIALHNNETTANDPSRVSVRGRFMQQDLFSAKLHFIMIGNAKCVPYISISTHLHIPDMHGKRKNSNLPNHAVHSDLQTHPDSRAFLLLLDCFYH